MNYFFDHIEIVWVAINTIGLAVAVTSWNRAFETYTAFNILDLEPDDGRWVVARANLRAQGMRVLLFAIFSVLGVMALAGLAQRRVSISFLVGGALVMVIDSVMDSLYHRKMLGNPNKGIEGILSSDEDRVD